MPINLIAARRQAHSTKVYEDPSRNLMLQVEVLLLLCGDRAFGRQSNQPPRQITEKSLAENFPAEC